MRQGGVVVLVCCVLASMPLAGQSLESTPRVSMHGTRQDGGVSAYKKGQAPVGMGNTNLNLKLEAEQLAKEIQMKRFRDAQQTQVQNKRLYEEGQKLQDKANQERHQQYKQMMEQMYGTNVMSDPQVGLKAHLQHVEALKKIRAAADEQRKRDQNIFQKLIARKRLHGSVYLAKIKEAAETQKVDQKKEVTAAHPPLATATTKHGPLPSKKKMWFHEVNLAATENVNEFEIIFNLLL